MVIARVRASALMRIEGSKVFPVSIRPVHCGLRGKEWGNEGFEADWRIKTQVLVDERSVQLKGKFCCRRKESTLGVQTRLSEHRLCSIPCQELIGSQHPTCSSSNFLLGQTGGVVEQKQTARGCLRVDGAPSES